MFRRPATHVGRTGVDRSGRSVTDTLIAGPRLAVLLVALVLVAAVVAWFGRSGLARPVVLASARATGQLAVVSLVIVAVLDSVWWSGAFVLLMTAVATLTSARRVGAIRTAWQVAVPIMAGAGPVFALLLLSGAVAARPVVLIPIAGILIGGAMTATSLAGVRAIDELRTRHGEYEAALALGFGDRAAALELCRRPAALALVPALDQTRTVGLVTLPGAFVGVLLGGGSPVQAGLTQLLVLIALLAVEAVAVVLTAELVAVGRIAG